MRLSKKLGAALLCLLVSGLAQLSMAASQEIEEIIVTATKRAESIQDVPIAISAFSGDDLEARGVQDMYGLQEVSPSLSVYSSSSQSNGGTVRIRGVGTTGVNPGLEAAVGTFIDGVYRSRAGLAFSDLTDIERIEVLRGPQGTLFGKNTSAGALHIITKQPEFERAHMISVSAGDYESVRVQASTTGPLVDGLLAYRLAGNFYQRDGFLDDVNERSRGGDSDGYNNQDRYTLKGQLLWTPTDTIESRFILDYTDKDEVCCLPRADRIVTGLQRKSSTSRSLLSLGEDPADVFADFLARNGFSPEEADPHKEVWDVALNHEPYETVEEWGIQNETRWDINDNLTMTSITAYREFDTERGVDFDFTGADILPPLDVEETFENFSQEFQFTWTAGNVDFLAGAYFYTEELVTDENFRLGSQGAEYLARIQTGLLDIAAGNPPGTLQAVGVDSFWGTTRGSGPIGSYDPATGTYISDGSPRPNHAPGDGYYGDYKQDTDGWSVFTHNVWHVTDRFDLTIGARYSNEKKEGQTRINRVDPISGTERELLTAMLTDTFNEDHCNGFGAVGSLCNNVSWKDDETEKEWTGTIKGSFAVTDDFSIYASVSRGYKAGGFNLDQQSIELDAFATNIASGGEARFLSPSLLGGSDPDWVAYQAANNIPASAGLTAFECGEGSGTSNPNISHLDCALFDDDHKFDPEFVDAFELGFKATMLDGALTANMALFYSEYEDFQLNTFTGTGFLVSNTDEMISKGAELETVWLINEAVTFSFGVTYADARYGDDLNAEGQSELSLYRGLVENQNNPETYKRIQGLLEDFDALEKIEGRQITHAPYWQGSSSLFVEQPVGELVAYGNLNVAYRGRHNTGSDLKPQKNVPDEVLVNLQLGLRSQDERWDVKLWARNLFDNQVKTIVFNSVFQNDGSMHTFVGPPRTIGVTLTSHL